ncbi:hypothetical protein [Chlorella virus XW01]|nr:hypothetical protein [Chlorella virus XW01]
MIYCSIEEAWGNYHQEKSKESEIEKNKEKINIDNKKNIKKVVEKFTESITEEHKVSEDECGKIIKHVMKCKKCQKKLKDMLTPKLISILKNLLEDYRDLFVLLLVGISILLFFNLVSNISN